MLTEDISISLSDSEILFLTLEAHKKDITLNQYINEILKVYIDQYEMDQEFR